MVIFGKRFLGLLCSAVFSLLTLQIPIHVTASEPYSPGSLSFFLSFLLSPSWYHPHPLPDSSLSLYCIQCLLRHAYVAETYTHTESNSLCMYLSLPRFWLRCNSLQEEFGRGRLEPYTESLFSSVYALTIRAAFDLFKRCSTAETNSFVVRIVLLRPVSLTKKYQVLRIRQ